jgi:hypothetical protein
LRDARRVAEVIASGNARRVYRLTEPALGDPALDNQGLGSLADLGLLAGLDGREGRVVRLGGDGRGDLRALA